MFFFACLTANLISNVTIISQHKLCCYKISEKPKERTQKENILQYVWQDAVTLRRHLEFGSTRRKKFLAARVCYYPNSTSYFHQPRLIILSGDVELNPGMVRRQSEGNIKHIDSTPEHSFAEEPDSLYSN